MLCILNTIFFYFQKKSAKYWKELLYLQSQENPMKNFVARSASISVYIIVNYTPFDN